MDYPQTLAEELISAYLDGELAADERANVEQALASNAELRQTRDDLLTLREELRSLPKYQLSDRFSDQVLSRLTKTGVSRPSPVADLPIPRVRKWQRKLVTLAAIAAAILVTILSFPLLRNDGTDIARQDELARKDERLSESAPDAAAQTDANTSDANQLVERARMAASADSTPNSRSSGAKEETPIGRRTEQDPAVASYVICVDIPLDSGGWQDFHRSLEKNQVFYAATPVRHERYGDLFGEILERAAMDDGSARSQEKRHKLVFVQAKREQINAIRNEFAHQGYRLETVDDARLAANASPSDGRAAARLLEDIGERARPLLPSALDEKSQAAYGFAFDLAPAAPDVADENPAQVGAVDPSGSEVTGRQGRLGFMLVPDDLSPPDTVGRLTEGDPVRALFFLERPKPQLFGAPSAPTLPTEDSGSSQ